MNTAGKSSQNDGPSTKDEGESSVLELFDRNTFQIGKMAQGSKDGKTRDNREERVGACDDARVQECGLVSLAVGTEGRHDAKGDTYREEDLCGGTRPNVGSVFQHGKIPHANVNVDTIRGTFKGKTLDQDDQEDEDSHGEVGDAAGDLGTKCKTTPDSNPSQCRVPNVGPGNARSCSVIAKSLCANNFFQEVVNGDLTIHVFICPRGGVGKGVKEGVYYPGEEHTVVDNEHPTTGDTGYTNSSKARVEGTKHPHISGLPVLAETDLEGQNRDTNEEEGHEVGDEEGAPAVFDGGKGRETPDISETDSRSDGSKVESRATRPHIFVLALLGNSSNFRLCNFSHCIRKVLSESGCAQFRSNKKKRVEQK